MTDNFSHLVADGNEVLDMKLVRTVNDLEDEETSFGPEMCHQVFGENESIFGYTDLHIRLYYTAGSLLTYLGIKFTDKIDPEKYNGMKADEIEKAIAEVIAPGYVTNIDRFVSLLEKDKEFKPYGKLKYSFTTIKTLDDGSEIKKNYEVYYCETSTPGFLEYHTCLQSFLLWYVDAASFIDVDDEMWTFFVVYEKYKSSEGDTRYATAGYSTVYRYYAFPDCIRPRISQVLVLPPFRNMGICANLIQAINTHFTMLPEVFDITVEDPSPEFQKIRNYVDAKNCQKLSSFQPAKLMEGFSKEMATQARKEYKINKKQARRVYEILRLRNIKKSNKIQYQKYRLDVKNRLNAPYQEKKLKMKKLQKVLSPDECAAAISTTGLEETYNRLNSQYNALEEEYEAVIRRLELFP